MFFPLFACEFGRLRLWVRASGALWPRWPGSPTFRFKWTDILNGSLWFDVFFSCFSFFFDFITVWLKLTINNNIYDIYIYSFQISKIKLHIIPNPFLCFFVLVLPVSLGFLVVFFHHSKVQKLNEADPHFIRCVKPNPEKAAKWWFGCWGIPCIYPPPRMQSWQMKVYRDSQVKVWFIIQLKHPLNVLGSKLPLFPHNRGWENQPKSVGVYRAPL